MRTSILLKSRHTIKPKSSNLTNHEKTDKQIQHVKISKTMSPIQITLALKASDELKIAKIEIAVLTA